MVSLSLCMLVIVYFHLLLRHLDSTKACPSKGLLGIYRQASTGSSEAGQNHTLLLLELLLCSDLSRASQGIRCLSKKKWVIEFSLSPIKQIRTAIYQVNHLKELIVIDYFIIIWESGKGLVNHLYDTWIIIRSQWIAMSLSNAATPTYCFDLLLAKHMIDTEWMNGCRFTLVIYTFRDPYRKFCSALDFLWQPLLQPLRLFQDPNNTSHGPGIVICPCTASSSGSKWWRESTGELGFLEANKIRFEENNIAASK